MAHTLLRDVKKDQQFIWNGRLYKATAGARVRPCTGPLGLRVDFSCVREHSGMPCGWELASIVCQDPDAPIYLNNPPA